MTTLRSGDTTIILDEYGFLDKDQVWNKEVAMIIAEHEGFTELNEEKMNIINFMRKYYTENHNFPILAEVCKKTGDTCRDCVAREFTDPMRAWKIAGLPKPPSIFFTTFDGKKYSPNPFY
ncbi:TusE/DsrC/DsvC family sulfur relay protein [Desulfotalea psychrophila]|nr:TusE/DsrC/DsvC family sulfur relay protein [Desulfotalea psychrophila]